MEMETNGNVLNSKLEFEQPRRLYNVKCNEWINTWLQSQILKYFFFMNEKNQSPDEANRRKISCKSYFSNRKNGSQSLISSHNIKMKF